jgi:replication factor C subunit 1
LVPLLVQENYLGVKPSNLTPRGGLVRQAEIDNFAKAAELISDADLIDRVLHETNSWELAPAHGVVSTIAPAFYAQGGLNFRLNFPSWLARYGSTARHHRLLKELHMHMSSKISANYMETRLDYMEPLRWRLVQPLTRRDEEDGIEKVIDLMGEYDLTREDWDSIIEISTLGESKLPKIESSVKSAMTRMYNKEHHAAPVSLKSKARATASAEERVIDEEGTTIAPSQQERDEDEDGEAEEGRGEADSDLKSDKMIIQKAAPKPRGKAAAGGKKPAAGRKKAKK